MSLPRDSCTLATAGGLILLDLPLVGGQRAIACVNAKVVPLLQTALERHVHFAEKNGAITVLVPPDVPPTLGVRNDGRVETFLASGEAALSIRPTDNLSDLCYQVLSRWLDGSRSDAPVNVVHRTPRTSAFRSEATIRVVLPHRGDPRHLALSLNSLSRQQHRVEVDICLDERPSAWTREAAGLNHLHRVSPSPAGPYVIRQHFGLRAASDFVGFQDSDDISTPERFSTLLDTAVAGDFDIVGCHELRVDEIDQEVRAFRFPLDVSEALRDRAAHPQFFPTTIVRSSTFRKTGGFSTIRRFGGDTQFLLRAYFSARIGNADEFLYIRRKRPHSLTTHPATALGSPRRERLDRLWKADFERVKSGKLRLEVSALRVHLTKRKFSFTQLGTGELISADLNGMQ